MPQFSSLSVGQEIEGRCYAPTNVTLFLYNAAIWNAHRIHYDEKYATEVEHHPAVVIDGPLQGDWLAQVAINWAGDDGELIEFEYSNRKACHLGQKLTSGGEVVALQVAEAKAELCLYIKDEAGDVVSPGRAIVQF